MKILFEYLYKNFFIASLTIFIFYPIMMNAQTCDNPERFPSNCFINDLGKNELDRAYEVNHPGKGSCNWWYWPKDLEAYIAFTVTEDVDNAKIIASVNNNQDVGIWLYESNGPFGDICNGGFTPKACNINDGDEGEAVVTWNLKKNKDYFIYVIYYEIVLGAVVGLEIIDGSCSHPLPIILSNLKAVKKDNLVEISWQTLSEINNNFFTIEKSHNAKNWFSIGNVNGAGNSNTILNYGYIDVDGGCDQYYRIRQTDYDGTESVSHIVSVNCTSKYLQSSVKFPNPNNGSFGISILSDAESLVKVEITDVLGRSVFINNYNLSIGNNSIEVNANYLDKSIYLINISNNSDINYNQKFIVE